MHFPPELPERKFPHMARNPERATRLGRVTVAWQGRVGTVASAVVSPNRWRKGTQKAVADHGALVAAAADLARATSGQSWHPQKSVCGQGVADNEVFIGRQKYPGDGFAGPNGGSSSSFTPNERAASGLLRDRPDASALLRWRYERKVHALLYRPKLRGKQRARAGAYSNALMSQTRYSRPGPQGRAPA